MMKILNTKGGLEWQIPTRPLMSVMILVPVARPLPLPLPPPWFVATHLPLFVARQLLRTQMEPSRLKIQEKLAGLSWTDLSV